MWRRPIWPSIYYFFVQALERAGKPQLARLLRENTLDLIMAQQGVYEYYDSVSGAPPPKAVGAFRWTAALFIDLALAASAGAGSNRARAMPQPRQDRNRP
jgi:glycogen debranching enzyme